MDERERSEGERGGGMLREERGAADSDGLWLAKVLKRNPTVKEHHYSVKVSRFRGGDEERVIVSDGKKRLGEVVLHHDTLTFEVVHGGHPVMMTVLKELKGYAFLESKNSGANLVHGTKAEELSFEVPVQEAEPEASSTAQIQIAKAIGDQKQKSRSIVKRLLSPCSKRR